MTSDDLKRLFLGNTLFRLDTIVSPLLVPILYAVGLVALLVWSINHLFSTFAFGFDDGLWGLVEIAVFGLLGLIVLRIACEALLVFFKAHEGATQRVAQTRISANLLDEVTDAIHDLAEADERTQPTVTTTVITPATPPSSPRPASEMMAPDLPVRGPTVRRTARRTPRPKPPNTPDL